MCLNRSLVVLEITGILLYIRCRALPKMTRKELIELGKRIIKAEGSNYILNVFINFIIMKNVNINLKITDILNATGMVMYLNI